MPDELPLGSFTASLSCGKCGSKELTIPDEPTDDSPVTCSGCGAEVARWGDVKAAVQEAAEKKAAEALKDALRKKFDGTDGVTFK